MPFKEITSRGVLVVFLVRVFPCGRSRPIKNPLHRFRIRGLKSISSANLRHLNHHSRMTNA